MIYNDPGLRGKKSKKVTLTLEGTGDETCGYIQIDGTKYYTPQTIEVDVGTEVYCIFLYKTGITSGHITVNGETVQNGDGIPTDYVYLTKVNATFNITERKGYYNLTITET